MEDAMMTPVRNRIKKREAVASNIVSPDPSQKATPKRKERDTERSLSPSKSDKRAPKALAIKKDGVKLFTDDGTSNVNSPEKKAPPISSSEEVSFVYKSVSRCNGSLGGYGYNGALYGEITMGSMQRVINTLIEQCEMNTFSRFIDVGSGLGKPNLHALQSPGVRLSIGVELEDIRYQMAMHILAKLHEDIALLDAESNLSVNHEVNFIVGDIDNAKSLDPFTHIYMYDLGFPPELQQSIAQKFNTSVHARYLVSYRPPHRVIDEYGYHVELVTKHDTAMFGSGEHHMAYFYRRLGTADEGSSSIPTKSKQVQITLPAVTRDHGKISLPAESVYCDPMFADAVQFAVGDFEDLHAHVIKVTMDHLNSPRARRVRIPRKVD